MRDVVRSSADLDGVARCLSPLPPIAAKTAPGAVATPPSSTDRRDRPYWTRRSVSVESIAPTCTEPNVVDDDLYRIGTVARLTGISVECLRAWERRYGLAPAERAGRTRYYSHAQLTRLTKIKALIDAGHPVSSLIELNDSQLDSRSRPVASVSIAISPHRLPRVGLIGASLVLLEQDAPDSNQVEVAQRWVAIDDFLDARERERSHLDAIVLQLPTLNFADLDRACAAVPDARWIVVYRFAERDAIKALEARGIPGFAWPIAWETLMRACATPSPAAARAGRAAPRRYSDHELVAIASRARERGRDAPRDIVALINDLNAFADFAGQRLLSDGDESFDYEQAREAVSYARAQLERVLAASIELHIESRPISS